MRMRGACFALLVVAGQAAAAAPTGKLSKLSCDTGPLTRTYGGVSWLVYGCADKHSILVVSSHGTSEYIMLSPSHGGVQVVSEGWSLGGAGDAAFTELKRMSARQLDELAAETRQANR